MLRQLLSSMNRVARRPLVQRRFFSSNNLPAIIPGETRQNHKVNMSNSSKLVLATLSFGVGYTLLDSYNKAKKEKVITTEENNVTTIASSLTPSLPEPSATDVFIKSLADAKNGVEIEKVLMNTKINEVVKDFNTLSTLFKDLFNVNKSRTYELDDTQKLYILSFFSDAIKSHVTTAGEIKSLVNDMPYSLCAEVLDSLGNQLSAIVNDYNSLKMLAGMSNTSIFRTIPTAHWKNLFLKPDQMSPADRIRDIYLDSSGGGTIILESFTAKELRQIYDTVEKLASILESIKKLDNAHAHVSDNQVLLLKKLGEDHIRNLLKPWTPMQQSDFIKALPWNYYGKISPQINIEKITEERLSATRASRP